MNINPKKNPPRAKNRSRTGIRQPIDLKRKGLDMLAGQSTLAPLTRKTVAALVLSATVASSGTAQTLLAPEGLDLVPTPAATPAQAPSLVPQPMPTPPATTFGPAGATEAATAMPPLVQPNRSAAPGSVVYGEPIYLDENGRRIPNPELTAPSALAPAPTPPAQQWNLHGFAPLPATPAIIGPQLGSPSVSTWQPVKPKKPATYEASTPARPTASSAVRPPTAARVWRAMGRLR